VEIVKSYIAARDRLSRLPSIGIGDISPRIKARTREIFGRDMTPEEVVAQILSEVKIRGDAAVLEYMDKIDRVQPDMLEVNHEQVEEAYRLVDENLVSSIQMAAERIRAFHLAQKEAVWHGVSGQEWGQVIRPLARVGLYAPGGTAPLVSTVLMIAIPPKVAGVKEIILATPPLDKGNIPPAMLVAADIAGVDRIFGISGAQAIAAMAYGTESVPRVDKICGPGNIFVVLAKKAVFGAVDIDALQGPSEVFIIADKSARPDYCAADLLAQAEHDVQSQVVLVTTSLDLVIEVERELHKQIAEMPRQQIAMESLDSRGIMAIVEHIDEAIELANLYAPEHLELAVKDAEKYQEKITNAGCIFLGEYSTEPLGDYVAGPNHSLPTGGTAKFSSPLNILDFIKLINVVKINPANLPKLGKAAITIARAEGLEAHARAVELRLKNHSNINSSQ
jgi:histidinol dehydrogenase